MNSTLCKIGEEPESLCLLSAGWSGSQLSLAEGAVTPWTGQVATQQFLFVCLFKFLKHQFAVVDFLRANRAGSCFIHALDLLSDTFVFVLMFR